MCVVRKARVYIWALENNSAQQKLNEHDLMCVSSETETGRILSVCVYCVCERRLSRMSALYASETTNEEILTRMIVYMCVKSIVRTNKERNARKMSRTSLW